MFPRKIHFEFNQFFFNLTELHQLNIFKFCSHLCMKASSQHSLQKQFDFIPLACHPLLILGILEFSSSAFERLKHLNKKTCTSNQFIIRKKGKNIPRLKEYKSKSEKLSVETYSPLTENDAVKIGYKAFNGVRSGSLHVASTFVDHMSIQKRADFLQAF